MEIYPQLGGPLDLAVAENIMDWRWVCRKGRPHDACLMPPLVDGDGHRIPIWNGEDAEFCVRPPQSVIEWKDFCVFGSRENGFSTNLLLALSIIEHPSMKTVPFTAEHNSVGWNATFGIDLWVTGSTLPEVICCAALRYIDESKPEYRTADDDTRERLAIADAYIAMYSAVPRSPEYCAAYNQFEEITREYIQQRERRLQQL